MLFKMGSSSPRSRGENKKCHLKPPPSPEWKYPVVIIVTIESLYPGVGYINQLVIRLSYTQLGIIFFQLPKVGCSDPYIKLGSCSYPILINQPRPVHVNPSDS